MNYYYDIILNWNEGQEYEFYEWNDTDYLELIKKIPLIKIKHKDFLNVLTNKIKVSKDFLEEIKDKTLLSTKKIVNKIEYACLITDGKNVLALEFNREGLVISRSKLLIDDELGILEFAYNLKDAIFIYEIVNPLEYNFDLRQEKDAKHLIELEIDNLYRNKDKAKLKYLYYEYKEETLDDIDIIYQNIKKDLEKDLNKELLKLYYVIKLSYHNV